MKREKISNYIGLFLLLACFAVAIHRIATRPPSNPVDGTERIRFSHWQLEGGLREAFDQLAREYEGLHPGVKIEQVAIPERTYAQWMRTQLVGETITELVQLGIGIDDEVLARFFTPLTEYVEQPNPYNAGTDLAGVPLRDTILDGMQGISCYSPNLLEYYGVPVSMFTVRMYYNRTLWQTMLGDVPPPSNYEEFLALCERIRAISKETGRSVIPIAGSKANAPALLGRLFSSQVQRLNQSLDTQKTMRPAVADIQLALLRGDWSIDDPAYTSGLEITRETAAYFQPGYSQLARDDASFYFLQNRALMIATGSWDSPSFRAQADFEIGVFSLPMPTTSHPRFGRYMLGRASEAETGTGLAFGIPKQTKNFDRALDFLHFLSSKSGNSTFSRVSGWLPSVVGVEPADYVKPFLPITDGYLEGFSSDLKIAGGNSSRVLGSANNILVDPSGSVQAFKNTIREPLKEAVRQDLARFSHVTTLNLNRQDAVRLAHEMLSTHTTPPPASLKKINEINESQTKLEGITAWTKHELTRIPE